MTLLRMVRMQCAQASICTELLRRLGEYGPSLARAVGLAAEVDCLVSLAGAAREGNYVRPLLTQDNVLNIKQGAPSVLFALAAMPLHNRLVTVLERQLFTSLDWSTATAAG